MPTHRRHFIVRVPGLIALASIASAPVGFAQAFVPSRGEGSIGLAFQDHNIAGHFLANGSRLPAFQYRARTAIADIEYGVTNRLAVSANLAYVNARYTGKEVPFNLPRNVLDDRKWHGSPQDFRFDVRYRATQRPFVFTPFFAAVIPSHNYDFIGEAAPGRHLREFLLGAYAGRLLNPVLPRAFVHGSYSYAIVERDLDLNLNRSNADFSVGYLLTRRASVNFLWRRQWTHGGVTFAEFPVLAPEVFARHDRLTRANYQHFGGGASIALNQRLDLSGTYIRFVSGQNEHYGRAIVIGLRWTFQTRARSSALRARPVPGGLAGIGRGLQ